MVDKKPVCNNCNHCLYEEVYDDDYEIYYDYYICELDRKEFDYNYGICLEFDPE